MKVLTSLKSWRVAVTIDDLLAFGKSHHWSFMVMEEIGVLDGEILKLNWVYKPDCNTEPVTPGKKEAYKRLKAVEDAGFPIKQVIYGYEVKKETNPEPKPVPKTEPFKLPDNTGEIVLAVVTGVGTVLVGAALVFGYGLLMAFSAVDPALIIVLDDGKDSWVCLSSWEE